VGDADEIHAGSGDDLVAAQMGDDTVWGDDGNDGRSPAISNDVVFGVTATIDRRDICGWLGLARSDGAVGQLTTSMAAKATTTSWGDGGADIESAARATIAARQQRPCGADHLRARPRPTMAATTERWRVTTRWSWRCGHDTPWRRWRRWPDGRPDQTSGHLPGRRLSDGGAATTSCAVAGSDRHSCEAISCRARRATTISMAVAWRS
jgi:hypothetical protein